MRLARRLEKERPTLAPALESNASTFILGASVGCMALWLVALLTMLWLEAQGMAPVPDGMAGLITFAFIVTGGWSLLVSLIAAYLYRKVRFEALRPFRRQRAQQWTVGNPGFLAFYEDWEAHHRNARRSLRREQAMAILRAFAWWAWIVVNLNHDNELRARQAVDRALRRRRR